MKEEELSKCIEFSENGVYLDLKVSPDSCETKIRGVNPWRNQLEVSIKEKAVQGEANKALVKLFAESLEISKKKIKIVKGKTTKGKRMYFDGVDKTELMNVVKRVSEGDR